MSRIGRMPVRIPSGVTVTLNGNHVAASGPKGSLNRTLPDGVAVQLENDVITVTRASDAPRHRALHGLSRSLVANMVEGVDKGFQKVLEIQGVGYKAEATARGVILTVGLSHTVEYTAPKDVTIAVEGATIVRVSGPSKELVGQVAAELRAVRPPEPYKGKGVRYQGEHVRRKAGKTGAK